MAKVKKKKESGEHIRMSSYLGKITDLKGYVYDVGYGARDQFARTTKEIGEYIARTHKNAGEFINALDPDNLGFEPIPYPADPDPLANRIVLKKWEDRYKEAADKERARKSVSEQAFSVILGQCSPAVRDRIQAQRIYAHVKADLDVIELLRLIRTSLYAGGTSKKTEQSAQEAVERLMMFKQGSRMSNARYLERFKELVEIVDHFGIPLGAAEDTLVAIIQETANDPLDPTEEEMRDAKKIANERFYSIMFLRHADRARYGNLVADLENAFTRGNDEFPKTMTSAFDYLINYRPYKSAGTSKNTDGMTFLTDQAPDGNEAVNRPRSNFKKTHKGRNKRSKTPTGTKTIKHQVAHVDEMDTVEDEKPDTEAVTPNNNDDKLSDDESIPYIYDLTSAVTFYQEGNLAHESLIIDSASSVNIISNKAMLTNVSCLPQSKWLPILTVGKEVVHLKHCGNFGKYPETVWYYPEGQANIMSLCNMKKYYRITMDTGQDDAFYLHNNGATIRFGSAMKGIYMLDHIDTRAAHTIWDTRIESPDAVMHNTVDDLKKQFTKRTLQQAKEARKFQNIIMRPSTRDMTDNIIRHMARCPITKRDIEAAEYIFGPNLGSLKGKTTRETPKHVKDNVDPVPEHILHHHQTITLCVDIMFVNQVPFMISISRNIKFITVEPIANRQSNTLKKALSSILQLYEHRGFKIGTVMTDNEFEHLRPSFPMLNTCAAGDHVPDVERCIRTIKEQTRACYSVLPFRFIPKIMLIHLVRNSVLWMNAFPSRSGMSHLHSPHYIMSGRELSYDLHARVEFGQYVQTHKQHDNSMSPRTMGAICLGPTGNNQGSHWFMSLTSGAKIIRNKWTELPTPTDVVHRVNQMGKKQGMPPSVAYDHRSEAELSDPLEDFLNDNGEGDNHDVTHEDSEVFTPEPRTGEEPQVIYDHYPHDIDDNQAPMLEPNNAQIDNEVIDLTGVGDDMPAQPNMVGDEQEIHVGDQPNGDKPPANEYAQDIPPIQHDNSAEHTLTEYQQFMEAEEDGRARAQTDEIGARTRQAARDDQVAGNDPQFIFATMAKLPEQDLFHDQNIASTDFYEAITPHANELMCFLTEQMSAKKGLRLFGQRGIDALTKELKQLLYRNVMHPVDARSLTKEQKHGALRYLMFLKEKRSGEVKGRGCADGRKQRVYKTKEETHSPTVSTEAMFITAMFDAMENRDVAIVDIPGAFMQAEIDELINIKLEGELVDLIVRIDPTYSKFIQMEKGKKVIYTELDKALYGTMQAALLFWKRITNFLVDHLGFTINPYDSCVANRMIEGTQFTICWHVDDLKLSHKSHKVVTRIINRLQKEFGKEAPLTVQRGKVFNDYLGMRMDFSKKGKVIFSMEEYIERLINETPDELLKGPCSTPAANHLFQVNENAPLLDDRTSKLYHHLTATILYLAKKTRPDIQTAVSFLSTRVKEPSIDDWKKLGRCIRYLSSTRDLVLTLEANNDGVIQWWVDASYAVHPNMRSHTGATMTLGKGSPFSMSTKQKINTRSSTEAELVGVNDAMALIIWTRLFIEAQGYVIKDNVVYQDNQSAILLENNGKRSSSKKTRHIEIRYFFVTDNIRRKQMRVEYCPTDDMRADFMTKPLQGSAFRKFRKETLNLQ